MDFVFADQVANGGGRDEDFHHHGAAAAVNFGKKRLAKNAFQHHGELRANLGLLVRGENVYDAVDRRDRRIGVQRGEGQVAGFSDAQSGFDGFQVAHFADEDDVGIFAQGGAQGIRKRMRVRVYFALVDQAFFVVVQEFDGVFDGDHVLFMLVIDFVEHGGERGGFAGAGGAGDEHQAARLVAEAANDVGQTERVESLDFPWNGTEHGSDGSALMEDVAAEARQAF